MPDDLTPNSPSRELRLTDSAPASRMGRPTSFTGELLEEICDRLAKGEPLTLICRDEHMPTDRTVRNWMSDAEVSSAIARAREVGFDAIAAECLAIADHTAGDTKIVGSDEYAHEAPDHEWISRSKLRVETRLKLLAKWDPKRYGEAVQMKHTDGDGGPLTVVIRKPA